MKKALLSKGLEAIYLEYVNDWLTVKAMAEHYEVEEDELRAIIVTAMAIRERYLEGVKE